MKSPRPLIALLLLALAALPLFGASLQAQPMAGSMPGMTMDTGHGEAPCCAPESLHCPCAVSALLPDNPGALLGAPAATFMSVADVPLVGRQEPPPLPPPIIAASFLVA